MREHLWLAGARRSSTKLHLQAALGRNTILADRFGMYLLWDGNGLILLNPFPDGFLVHYSGRLISAALTTVVTHALVVKLRLQELPIFKIIRELSLGSLYSYL